MDIIFLHGLESGPHGSKFQSIRDAGWTVSAPDCTGVGDVTQRVAIAREALEAAAGPVVLVGSSFGGLTGARLHADVAGSPVGERIHGLLLLAPALHVEGAEAIDRCHPNTVILHGVQDDVVPVEASRSFAERFGCMLVEVEDGHRLKDSHARILSLLQQVAGVRA